MNSKAIFITQRTYQSLFNHLPLTVWNNIRTQHSNIYTKTHIKFNAMHVINVESFITYLHNHLDEKKIDYKDKIKILSILLIIERESSKIIQQTTYKFHMKTAWL